jgi:hypothetical protein
VERSITQATPGDGALAEAATDRTAEAQTGAARAASQELRIAPFVWGILLLALCMAVYVVSNPNRQNQYVHFVWQAQSWLDGETSIPTNVEGSGTSSTPGNSWYQDIQPILDSQGQDTSRGTIPFPPLPALVLLPFVAFWHLATNEQLLAAIFAALDVGVAFWMLGYLPIRREIRGLTALFLGLGTVLWYAAAIGTTWFWAHIVAVGCLLLAIGLALSADGEAAEPRPLSDGVAAARKPTWPGGWWAAATIVVLGALGELLFLLAGAGTPPAAIAGVGVLLAIVAATLAVAVSGQRGVLVPLAVVVGIAAGLPAALLLVAHSASALAVLDVAALGLVVGLVVLARARPEPVDRVLITFWDALSRPESRQVAAGLFFGLACTARLTIAFGFPFLLLVGGGGSWLRRGLLAGAGAAVPAVALLVYTYAGTGQLFNPSYDYLYQRELGYWFLNYHADWSIEDLRYVPQNLMIFLFNAPLVLPGHYPWSQDMLCQANQARGLFDRTCPIATPDWVGMSVFLTSPAYLLAPLAFIPALQRKLDPVTVGAAIAVVAIAFVNLMHFSQGWVQFGYRFSNDFAPFAIVLVALGASRLGRFWPVLVPFVTASIAVNLWGTVWGVMLGW